MSSCEHKCLEIASGHSYVEMYKMAHPGQARGHSPPWVPSSSTKLWMWHQCPSTLHWKPGSRARFTAIPISGSDNCQLLPVTCFVEILVRWETVKQKLGEAGFCTPSGCFDLQSVLPAVERNGHLMCPLHMSPVITLEPDLWDKLRWVPTFGQHLNPSVLGTIPPPTGVCWGLDTAASLTVTLETAYPML